MAETRPGRKRGVRKGTPTEHSSAYMARGVAEACLTCPYKRCIAGEKDGCERYVAAVRAELDRRRAAR